MTLRLDPQATCDACGCYGAYRFETETLCADCYAGRGSCCSSEFNGSPPDHGPQPRERADRENDGASRHPSCDNSRPLYPKPFH